MTGEAEAWAIEVEGLTKTFDHRPVLRGVNLRVAWGTFVTIFGPNGAGKTTLLKILATLIRPASGWARLAGRDLAQDATEVRRLVGVTLHQTLLYDELTAYENLLFYGRMFDVPNLEKRIEDMAALVGLSPRLHHRVRTFSRGMQQRLTIARALLHDPLILLLDEPETGLDQEAAAVLESVLKGATAQGKTALMTTHSLERGLRLGDHVAILAGGRIVYEEREAALDLAHFQGTYERYTAARR